MNHPIRRGTCCICVPQFDSLFSLKLHFLNAFLRVLADRKCNFQAGQQRAYSVHLFKLLKQIYCSSYFSVALRLWNTCNIVCWMQCTFWLTSNSGPGSKDKIVANSYIHIFTHTYVYIHICIYIYIYINVYLLN